MILGVLRRRPKMRINKVKRTLQEGKPVIGSWLNLPCTNSAEAMAHAGWDFLAADAEHGPLDLGILNDMFIAIGTTDTIPMCRVPANDPVYIKRILDAGAYGCVIPMVCSAEEARQAVASCKYPPEGIRSTGGGRWRYWAGDDYRQHANDEILVVVQIEHIDAVKRAKEILSVPGVDACFIGPSDLAWSMGLGKELGEKDPSHAEAVAEVLRAAKKVGVPAGIHCRNAEEVPRRVEEGFLFLACINESTFMFNAARAAVKSIRERIGK